jgi:hypothetical protein
MKKTVTMNAQAAVDSTYDVKEGFCTEQPFIYLSIFFILMIVLFQDRITKRKEYTLLLWFIFALAIFLLLRSIY